MKKLWSLLFLFAQIQAFANMANPVQEGTLGARPFVSEYVEVLHEDLLIKIGADFQTAQFKAVYHIKASKAGQQIPFLFYASEYQDGFTVNIDGKTVELKDMSYDFGVPEETKFKDFSYFFEGQSDNLDHAIILEEDSNEGFYVSLQDMIFFEADIPEGEHVIEVSYQATSWVDGWDWVNEYSFRYALSPAKYWMSFGTLHIEIDATDVAEMLSTNLGEPQEGNLTTTATWDFDTLPTEILMLTYRPEISKRTQKMLQIGPQNLASLTGLLLVGLHVFWLIGYRRRNPSKRYSIVQIVGSIIVPLLFVICWRSYYDLIDSMIGVHASGTHGYATFFILLLFPVILPFYYLISWGIDRVVKSRSQ